jgi:hypothetical protein
MRTVQQFIMFSPEQLFHKLRTPLACCYISIRSCRQYYPGDKIRKNELGMACGTCWGEERCIRGFWCGNLTERDHLEDLGVDGRIIMELFSNRLGEGIDLIYLVQDIGK